MPSGLIITLALLSVAFLAGSFYKLDKIVDLLTDIKELLGRILDK